MKGNSSRYKLQLINCNMFFVEIDVICAEKLIKK